MKKRQFSPDAATSGSNDEPVIPHVIKTGMIPLADANLLTLGKSVNTRWQATPTLTLVWTTQPIFNTLINSFDSELTAKLLAGSNRPAQTLTLQQLDKQIDNAVGNVKLYIQKKFKKDNASAQYARYGINKLGKTYLMPKDRDARIKALPLMKDAVLADGFGTEEFGTTFWTNMITTYAVAFAATTSTTKAVSSKTATKNTAKDSIIKVLKSIIKLIEANYPDTNKKVLRDWGFIKQNY